MSYADDRAVIEDLMARYLVALDFFDADAAEDGVLDWAMAEVHGREAIRAEALAMRAKMAEVFGPGCTTRHFVTNIAISVSGDHTEPSAARFTPPRLGTFGYYEDGLARVDGHRLFTRRRIGNEFIPGREAGRENPVVSLEHAA